LALRTLTAAPCDVETAKEGTEDCVPNVKAGDRYDDGKYSEAHHKDGVGVVVGIGHDGRVVLGVIQWA
jgi:hypothetical protein